MPGLLPSRNVLDSPEFEVLTKYASSDSQTVDQVIEAFCKPVEDKYMATCTPSESEELLWQAWRALIAVAAGLPIDNAGQERLADFVVVLQTRAELNNSGKLCVIQGMTAWRDLPLFGWEMREAWDAAASDEDDTDIKQRWVNINGWAAQLTATAHVKAHDRPDMSLYCIWTVRIALEAGQGQQPSNVALSAAAVWFVNAGPAIWDFCRQGKAFDGKVAKPGAMFSDKEWRGFTRDRWRAWANRLIDVQGQISNSQTSQLVEQARTAMGEVVER